MKKITLKNSLLDVYKSIRKTWSINPKTKIKESKKKYNRQKEKQRLRKEKQ